MQKRLLFLAILIVSSLPTVGWTASLEQARNLESQGRRDSALEELDQILTSDAPPDEMAGALDLLGTIAVDEGDLQLAYESWHRLVGEYPDLAKGLDATTKLKLVTSLMEAKGVSPQSAASEGPMQPSPDEPASAPTEPPVATAAEKPAAAAPESAPDQGATAAQSSQRPDPPPTTGKVLVAVSGKPYDAAVETGEIVIAFLRERGVDAVSATEGIPVVRDASALVPVMVQRARDEGASSALLIDAEFPGRQKVSAECYSGDGAQFWKTRVVGGTGWTGRDYSKTGINMDLVDRFTEKLSDLIGGPGLPVTMQ